jgi:hypothetical protein
LDNHSIIFIELRHKGFANGPAGHLADEKTKYGEKSSEGYSLSDIQAFELIYHLF